jgi:hypothetical protein
MRPRKYYAEVMARLVDVLAKEQDKHTITVEGYASLALATATVELLLDIRDHVNRIPAD